MKRNSITNILISFPLWGGLGWGVFSACTDDLPVIPDEQPATEQVVTPEAEPGQALVKVKASATIEAIMAALPQLEGATAEPLFTSDPRRTAQEQESGLNRWYTLHFSPDFPVARATVLLQATDGVEAAQANRRMSVDITRRRHTAMQLPATRAAEGTYFNDPALPYQWNYINTGDYTFNREGAVALPGSDVNCAEAWPLCTGDPSIIVAVMDEGVMYTHPDLKDNMWVNEGETLGSTVDNDGNGFKGDVYGWNCVQDNPYISWFKMGDTGHGTHVAGTIAAVNNNGLGVCGIAGGSGKGDGVKIMSLQVFDDGYTCLLSNECRGMKYAADNGAVILQCSWGYNSWLANLILGYNPGPKDEEEWASLYPLEKDAIDYFTHYAGSPNGVIEGGLAFYASGNEYAASSSFPAAYSGCISVSAISADYSPASYADYGSEVELCAPGGDLEQFCLPGTDTEEYLVGADAQIDYNGTQQAAILSTCVVDAQDGYAWYEGTSMACPNAAGVAALGLSYAKQMGRHYTAQEFRELMCQTGRDIDDHFTGEKTYYYNHTSQGASTTVMDLSQYRGRMGRLVDAGALLKAIEAGGNPMVMPNVKLTPTKAVTLDLPTYFRGCTTFGCTVDNTQIATATVSGSTLTVSPVAEGITTATITADGNTRSFVITVRRSNPHGGWLAPARRNK